MIGVGFAGFVDNAYVAIALFSLAGFAHQTLSVTVITMASDLFKKNEVATVAGMAGTFGNGGLLVFTLLIGALVTTIGYAPFFIGLGVLDLTPDQRFQFLTQFQRSHQQSLIIRFIGITGQGIE